MGKNVISRKEKALNRIAEVIKGRECHLKGTNIEYSDLFKDDVFSEDNWNSPDSLIREFTYDLEYSNKVQKLYEFSMDGEDYVIIPNFTYYYDDRIASLIVNNDVYLIKWYKSRGKTDLISKNGHPITKDEYMELLCLLHCAGYKFRDLHEYKVFS